MLAMSDKLYNIDDIIREIKENKMDEQELARLAEDYQKFDTTALLDDVLGRESDKLLDGIPVSDSALTEEENKLLEQILKEEPEIEKQLKAQQEQVQKTQPPRIKPLRPVSEAPKTPGFNPLQSTPATTHGKDFAVHKDSVTGLISKVEIQKEAKRQAEQDTRVPFEVESGFKPKRPRPFFTEEQKQSLSGKAETAVKAEKPASISASLNTEKKAEEKKPVESKPAVGSPAETKQEIKPAETKPAAERKPSAAEQKPQTVQPPKAEEKKETAQKPQIKKETVTPVQQIQTATFEAHTDELPTPSLSVEEPTIEALPYGVEEPTLEADPAELARHAQRGKTTRSSGDGTFSSVTTEIQGTPLNVAGVKTSVDLNDTAKLKYIALRKNRQSKVRDFSLEADFNKSNPEQTGKAVEADLSINVTPPPMKLPLIEDLTDELERQERGDSPLFRASQKEAPDESDAAKRWEEASAQAAGEEYTAYSQTEDLYDTLHELKHGMIFRCAAAVVLFILSLGMVLLNRLPNGNPVQLIDPAKNPIAFCAANLVIMALLCAFSSDTLRDGFLALFRRRPSKATLYSLALTVMTVYSAVIIIDPEMVNGDAVFLYVPVMALCIGGWYVGRILNFSRILKNFHFVSGKTDKYSACLLDNQRLAEDFTKGALDNRRPHFVLNRKTPFLSGFIKESLSQDVADQQSKYVVPMVCGLGLIAAVTAFLMGGDIFTALTVLSGVLIVGAGITPAFVSALPLSQAQKELSRMGGAVLGYRAVEEYSDVNSMLISANDLFRTNDVTLYGIKTFSNMAIDRAILDATSVLCETKSILGGIFLNIISDRKDYLDPVDTLIYEDGMGISAWIKDRRVLVGSRELMINHNIDVPSRDYESRYLAQNRNLIYLSAAGELSAVFVVGVKGNDDSRNMLVDLYNHDITAIVKTVDPILTKSQLAEIFDMPEDAFRVIPSRLHKEEEILSDSEEALSGAVSNNGTFPAYLYSVLAAKLLHRKINLTQLVSCVAVGLGVLLFIVFTALKSVSQLSPATLCIYEGAWLVVLWAISKARKIIS